MTLLVPAALLGLALLPLLWLLHRWRNRPRDTVWPSLLLWTRIAEGGGERRRRIDLVLLLEIAAILALVLAASAPVLGSRQVVRVLVHVDHGAHMEARRRQGRTAMSATRAEIDRLRRARGETVEVVEIPWRGAVAEGLIATGRDILGGFGYAAQGVNHGIGAVRVRGDRLWFTVETDGSPRDVTVRIGSNERKVRTGTGVEVDFSPKVEVLDADNYDGDDVVVLRRARPVARAETGSTIVNAALFRAGLRAVSGTDPVLIVQRARGDIVADIVHGRDCVALDPLFEGLVLDDCHWRDVRECAGTPALTWRGRAIASFRDGRLELGMPVERAWDGHGTLAVLVERALHAAIRTGLAPGEALVGDAIATPAPRFVDTRGVDRPWDGTLPPAVREGGLSLRAPLALLAAAIIAVRLLFLIFRRAR